MNTGLANLGVRFAKLTAKLLEMLPAIFVVVSPVDLIEAASKTVDLLKSAEGIGAPVDVALLGDEPRPKRLRWK